MRVRLNPPEGSDGLVQNAELRLRHLHLHTGAFRGSGTDSAGKQQGADDYGTLAALSGHGRSVAGMAEIQRAAINRRGCCAM
jgi:hypothetical protein